MTLPNSSPSLKTYWSSGHGKQMQAVIVGGALLAGFGIFKALPMIIAGFANLVVATSLAAASVISLAGLGALVYFLTRPALWQAVTIRLNNAAQKARRREIERDPIGTGEQAIKAMRKHHETVKNIGIKLWGAVKVGEKNLTKLQTEREERLRLYDYALKQGTEESPGEAERQARAAQVRENAIKANQPGVLAVRKMAEFYDRVDKNVASKILMFEDELGVLKQDLEIKAAGKAAGDAALRTLSGPEFDLLRESIEVTVSQISQFEAGIEKFVAEVVPSLREEDLRNGMLNEQAMKSAQAWLSSQNEMPDKSSVIESDEARGLLTAGSARAVARLSGAKAPAVSDRTGDDFSSFLK